MYRGPNAGLRLRTLPPSVAADYLAGTSIRGLTLKYKATGSTITRWLAENGIPRRRVSPLIGRRLTKKTRRAIADKMAAPTPPGLVAAYLAGESIKSLARRYGISRGGRRKNWNGKPCGIVRMLLEAGVKLRTKSQAEYAKHGKVASGNPAR